MTLRELLNMVHARQEDQWNHTAAVMALVANVNRDPKKGRASKPADFHPIRHRPRTSESHHAQAAPIKADICVLKTVFVDNAPIHNRRNS